MTTLRLYKREKLCSKTAIDLIFTKGEGCVATSYPLRAVWRVNSYRGNKDTQFLISVPKKRFKHAVDRVKLRRRIREAYRLNRVPLTDDENIAMDIAFIYLGNTIAPYKEIEQSLVKVLGKITASLALRQQEQHNENEADV